MTAASEFKVGDLVRIARQPPGEPSRIADLIGFVEEVREDGYALFQAIKLDGNFDGCGSVPISYLSPETGEHWVRALALYRQRRQKHLEMTRRYSDAINKARKDLAAIYGLTPEDITAICNAMEKADRDNNPYSR